MKIHDLRNLGLPELTARVADWRAEYYTLQEAVRLGKERNHARLRQLRADIARALTVLRQAQ